MTQPIHKLTDSKDFQNIARNAKRWTGSCFVVQGRARQEAQGRARDNAQTTVKQPLQSLRFGLTASRKVGNAIVRNRCKRRLREIVRGFVRDCAQNGQVVGDFDVVIIARTCCATIDFKVLQDDFRRAMRHLGVVAS